VNTPLVAVRSAVKNEVVDVALVNDADTAERRLVKKLVDVAFVVEAFVATNVVAVALVAIRLVAVPLVVVKLITVPLAEVRLAILPFEIVVVASADVPVAVNVPATKLVVVALVAVSEVKNAVTKLASVAKRLDVEALVDANVVAVAFVATSDVTVVVASAVVPYTLRFPVVEALPVASTAKLEFAVHAEPFQ
jgi:hypothetical protein